MLDFSAEELREMQWKDATLNKIREAAQGTPNSAGVGFFRRGGLLYRRWVPPGQREEDGVEQLILSTQCQGVVLRMGHEIPLARHVGTEKTRQRILRRFYWPTVFRDVKQFARAASSARSLGISRYRRHFPFLSQWPWSSLRGWQWALCWTSSQEQCRPQVHFGSVWQCHQIPWGSPPMQYRWRACGQRAHQTIRQSKKSSLIRGVTSCLNT